MYLVIFYLLKAYSISSSKMRDLGVGKRSKRAFARAENEEKVTRAKINLLTSKFFSPCGITAIAVSLSILFVGSTFLERSTNACVTIVEESRKCKHRKHDQHS